MNEVRRAMGASSMARLVTLPITAVATAVTTYLAVGYVGGTTYGYIALIGTLFQLVPFADLGLGAVVTNAVAERSTAAGSDSAALATIRRVLRLLTLVAGCLLLVVGVLSALGVWTSALGLKGKPGPVNVAVFAAIAPFLMSIPLGVGQRILVGEGRAKELAYISVAGPVFTTALTAALIQLRAQGLFLAAGPSIGVLLVSTLSLAAGMKFMGATPASLRRAHGLPNRIAGTAGPYLVISVGIPLAVQSDRIILSHASTASQLASHAVGSQLYAPCFSIVSAGSLVLWPLFVRNRQRALAMWHQALRQLGALGFGLAVLYIGLSGLVTRFISHDTIRLSFATAIAFGLLILVMSLHQASAMLLTSPQLLAFQAKCVIVMLVMNIPLSVGLADVWGASGPVFGSAISIASCQLIPGIIRARAIVRSGPMATMEVIPVVG